MTRSTLPVARPLATGALVAGLIALAAGCGSSSGASAGSTPAASTTGGSTVLAAAYQATNGAHTARVQIRTQVSASARGSSLNTSSTADGVIDFGNGSRDITTSLPTGGGTETRVVGGALYVHLPSSVPTPAGSKPWTKASLTAAAQASLSSASDPSQLLGLLKGAADAVTKVGSETVRGVPTTHYKAQIDLARLQAETTHSPAPGTPDVYALLRKALGRDTLPMDLWVDGSQRIARLQTVSPLVTTTGSATAATPGSSPAPPSFSTSQTGTATSIEEFYDYGVAVDIQAPPADQVQDAPALPGLVVSSGSAQGTPVTPSATATPLTS